MITLNAIAKRLEEFATNHFFIRSYSFGSPDDVDLEKFQEFPLMHVVYTGSDYDERTKTFSFEVYVFDRPNREEQMTLNQREVVSDAQLCLEDIIADIANGGNIFLFDEDYEVSAATVTPLVDERSNLLTGALLDFTIQVPFQRDACNLPVNGVSPEGGELAYARRGILRVKTQDGATDVLSVNEIRVTNGTLTDEGNGVVSINTGAISDTSITLDDGSNVSYSAVGPMQFYTLRIPAISDWTIVSGIVAVQIQFVLNPNTITLSNITTGYRLTGSLVFSADLDSAGTVLFELRGNNGSVVGSSVLNGVPGVNTQGMEIDKLLISETEVITARMISFGPPVGRAYIESATLTITT